MKKKLLFVTNVDWYYALHWEERICSKMTDGYQVTICYSPTKPLPAVSHPEVIPLNIKRSSINPFSNLDSFLQTGQILKRHQFDFIHSVTIKPNIYFGLFARRKSLPIILTIPGLGTVFSMKGLQYSILKKIILSLYRLIGKNPHSFFVFENSSDRNIFIKQGICTEKNSSVVAGAGVDTTVFRYSREESPGGGPLRLLFASRLLRGKGLEDLIRAVQQLKKKGEKIQLDLAGIIDNDSKNAIPVQQIEKWHEDGEINWLGQVDDMPQLLGEVHVVALPTKYGEGLPRILLEAASCGRPVITTDTPGCKDFVEHKVNGYLVSPGSIDELCLAIEFMQKQENRIKLGRIGHDKIVSQYTTDKVIEQYRHIYQLVSVRSISEE